MNELRLGEPEAGNVKDYQGYLDKYLIPAFGHMRMASIQAEHVQRHVANLVREVVCGPRASEPTGTAQAHVRVAKQWGYANDNPAESISLPRDQHTEVAFLSPTQMRALIEHTDPQWQALIALCCMCGLRKGECLGLTFDCILWTNIACG